MAPKPLPTVLTECWPIEQRILAYLDQRGRRRHEQMVEDLASPESKIARGIRNGSNGFVGAIASNWTRRLRKERLVARDEHLSTYTARNEVRKYIVHDGYRITDAGKRFLREGTR